jgi:glycosyltransferase involved in cell wall biosynthesis
MEMSDFGAPTVTHVVHSIGRKSFGLGSVAGSLAAHQQSSGWQAEIWCLDDETEAAWGCRRYGLPSATVRRFPRFGPERFYYAPSMEREARKQSRLAGSILHQHGIWSGLSRVSGRWRKHARGAVVVAPHGALAPFARRVSAWKKHIAWAAYERDNLENCACVHALNDTEAVQCREFGVKKPIAVIPNGISPDWLEEAVDQAVLRTKLGLPRDVKIMLYVGRLHPQKGLSMLLDALALLRPSLLKEWKVVIGGVDERNHQSELRAKARRLGLSELVLFPGPLFDAEKRVAFASADLFVLPSYSEAFPIGILEAMGAGVAVITTTAVPLDELRSGTFGWYVAPETDAISAAINDAFSCELKELRNMGSRGRELVRGHYTWPRVAAETERLYQWLAGASPQPEFVRV